MTAQHGYPVLNQENIDTYLEDREQVVLFFAEDPKHFPESDDVAMILPELVKAFSGRLEAALVDPKAEHALQRRYGFGTWPALVFLRRGEYLGAITRVQNWDDYLREIERLLDAEPVKAPGFKVSVVNEPVHGCH
jgi:hydrogenase-1 operon protein HyaE